jgi:hypothetical protein
MGRTQSRRQVAAAPGDVERGSANSPPTGRKSRQALPLVRAFDGFGAGRWRLTASDGGVRSDGRTALSSVDAAAITRAPAACSWMAAVPTPPAAPASWFHQV